MFISKAFLRNDKQFRHSTAVSIQSIGLLQNKNKKQKWKKRKEEERNRQNKRKIIKHNPFIIQW